MDSRKIVFRQTGVILLGQAVCIAVMFGVYALLGKWSAAVLLGGVIGGVLAVANFFFMSVGVSLASDRAANQNVKGGKTLLQVSFLLRYGLLFLGLFAGAKSGKCDIIALVLPLLFVRPILTLGTFFKKKGGEDA